MFSGGSAGNSIDISIRGDASQIMRTLNGVRRHAENVGAGVQGVGDVATNQSPKVASFFNQFLGANAAMGALSKLREGVGGFFSKMSEATQFQTQSMALAGDVGTNLGLGFKEANASVLSIQKEIAVEAARLPGITKQYNDVFNALGGSVAKVFPNDLPKFREAVMDVTKRVGALAAVKHVDATEAGIAINRAISGTTGLGELQQMALFERSPQFVAALRSELAKANLEMKDWKEKTTDKMRLDIVRKALSTATADSLMSEFEGTVESLWAGIQTKINDPLIGMFGFLRDIPSLNNTTVMDSVKDFLQAFVRLSTQFGKFAGELGLSFDPLAPIARFISWLATLQYGLAAAFEFRVFNLENIIDLDSIGKGIGDWFNNLVGGIFRLYDRLDVSGFAKGLGVITSIVPQFLTNTISSIDWSKFGFIIGDLLGRFAISFILNLPRNLVSVANLFSAALWGILKALVGAVLGLFYGLIIAPLKEDIEAAVDPIVGFFKWISDGIKSLWDKVRGLLDGAGRMLSLPGQAVQTIMTTGGSLLDKGKEAAGNVWNAITGKPADPTNKAATEAVKAVTSSSVGTGGVLPSIAPAPATTTKPVDAPKMVSAAPLAAPEVIAMGGAPLPSVQNQQTTSNAMYAPVVNVPVTQGINTDQLIASLMTHLDRQYSDFKRQRIGATA